MAIAVCAISGGYSNLVRCSIAAIEGVGIGVRLDMFGVLDAEGFLPVRAEALHQLFRGELAGLEKHLNGRGEARGRRNVGDAALFIADSTSVPTLNQS